jgi:SprT protein
MVKDSLIDPIKPEQQQQVLALTRHYIQRAGAIYHQSFASIPVRFNLKGRAAGMYRVKRGQREIRYNPYLFAKYYDDNLATTIPHEVAHYITDVIYGLSRIRPHGEEWRQVMQLFGADASRTCRYDLEGIPVRHTQRHPYRCGCEVYNLSTQRHRRIQSGRTRYFCRNCGTELQPEKRLGSARAGR